MSNHQELRSSDPPGCALGREPKAKARIASAARKGRSRFPFRFPAPLMVRIGVIRDK